MRLPIDQLRPILEQDLGRGIYSLQALVFSRMNRFVYVDRTFRVPVNGLADMHSLIEKHSESGLS